jgi:hypothetical protein
VHFEGTLICVHEKEATYVWNQNFLLHEVKSGYVHNTEMAGTHLLIKNICLHLGPSNRFCQQMKKMKHTVYMDIWFSSLKLSTSEQKTLTPNKDLPNKHFWCNWKFGKGLLINGILVMQTQEKRYCHWTCRMCKHSINRKRIKDSQQHTARSVMCVFI